MDSSWISLKIYIRQIANWRSYRANRLQTGFLDSCCSKWYTCSSEIPVPIVHHSLQKQ